jgi:mannose-6-phosphate isomerase
VKNNDNNSYFYALKFTPIYKDKIWGGGKFHAVLSKENAPEESCGESWEVSAVEGDESVVANGELKGLSINDLIEQYGPEFLGDRVYGRFGKDFPLLIKFLDADQDLSIQVHPGDSLAKSRHDSFGKSEMWYIMEADENARLISGFNRPMNKEGYVRHFDAGTLDETLNRVDASAGEVYYIPAGRIHTIGKGLLIAEIQQTSDITYRIYDFDRTDKEGNKRELHTAQAVDAINYNYIQDVRTHYIPLENGRAELLNTPYFVTNVLDYSEGATLKTPSSGSFTIYTCVEGAYEVVIEGQVTQVQKGEVILLPGAVRTFDLKVLSSGRLLETYLPE